MDTYESLLNDYQTSEPYVGMPIKWLKVEHLNDVSTASSITLQERTCPQVDDCPVAMAYVPWQAWGEIYDPEVGFQQGTIFPELDKPFLGGGTR